MGGIKSRLVLYTSDTPIELTDKRGVSHRNKFDIKSVIGLRNGRLTIIDFDHDDIVLTKSGKRRVVHYVRCRCDCGTIKIFRYTDVKPGGSTKSCGCILREFINRNCSTHGLWKHPLFNIHSSMIQRCYNPTSQMYSDYGGRGIYICDEWYTPGIKGNPGFVAFYNWAISCGYKYEKGAGNRNIWTIDRIDNDGPYAPWNCQWVTCLIQENNRRNVTHIKDIDGTIITCSQFERKYNMRAGYVAKRRSTKWPDHVILYDALHPEFNIIKHSKTGEFMTNDGCIMLIPSFEIQQAQYRRRI